MMVDEQEELMWVVEPEIHGLWSDHQQVTYDYGNQFKSGMCTQIM